LYVSIILPTYNRKLLLGRAIQSILDQSYQNFEIIVVDDCSSDNTDKFVKSIKDKRIQYIQLKKRKGANIARNTGIKAAKGDYIAFQDSDDVWLDRKLEKQMKAFKESPEDIGVIYTSRINLADGKKSIIPSPDIEPKEGNLHDILLKTGFIATPTAVVKRECFAKVGMFDENLPREQDWDLWIRISKHYRFKHIDEPLVKSYLQTDSISGNTNSWIIARKLILEKYFDEISKKPEVLSDHYYWIGTALILNGEIKVGRSYFLKAIRLYPFKITLLLSTLASLFGLKTYNKALNFWKKFFFKL
jgi:glycosyltransferase involved in cell wall biosynthesis